MNVRELKGYLGGFQEDSEISIIVVNPKGRVHHDVEKIICITDAGYPILGFEVGGVPLSMRMR